MANSTLSAIIIKARRLTRSLSENQISDADITEYVNTFLLYDLPSHLKLSNLRQTFSFYTQPNVDTYTNVSLVGATANPMFDFNNMILTSSDPIYIAGYKSWFSQSREEFFLRWNMLKQMQQLQTTQGAPIFGDGVTTRFIGTLSNFPVLPNEVLFTSINSFGFGIGLVGKPLFDATTGIQRQYSNFYDTNSQLPTTDDTALSIFNNLNCATGQFIITFSSAPGNGEIINVQAVPYVASRPTSVLYYNQTFTLRPVPDQQYDVNIECNVLPTALINPTDNPDLNQWWQYIAYGTAKKILEDRLDNETLALIMPEFKEQEKLVLRRTIEQQGDQRTTTIYSQQTSLNGGPWGWWDGQ